jgi:hypothetical protein
MKRGWCTLQYWIVIDRSPISIMKGLPQLLRKSERFPPSILTSRVDSDGRGALQIESRDPALLVGKGSLDVDDESDWPNQELPFATTLHFEHSDAHMVRLLEMQEKWGPVSIQKKDPLIHVRIPHRSRLLVQDYCTLGDSAQKSIYYYQNIRLPDSKG